MNIKMQRRQRRRQRLYQKDNGSGSSSLLDSRHTMIFLVLLIHISSPPMKCGAADNKLEGQLLISPCLAHHKSAHLVTISHLQLLCASKGSYYHEAGSYTRSTTCTYSDRAKLYMLLTISSAFNGSGILLTLDAGLYNALQPVLELVNFCKTGTWTSIISSKAYNSTQQQQPQQQQHVCPSSGTYNVSFWFKVPSIANDMELRYTPEIRLKFYSASNSSIKLGCYQSGTHTMINQATTHSEIGTFALALATIAFLLCFACMLYMAYRRKKRQEQMILFASRSAQQQHPYVRTNSSGLVIPISES